MVNRGYIDINGIRYQYLNLNEKRLLESGYRPYWDKITSNIDKAKTVARELRAHGYKARVASGYDFESGTTYVVYTVPEIEGGIIS